MTTQFNIGIYHGGHAGWTHDEDGRHETWVETFSIQATSPRGDTWVLDGSDTEHEWVAKATLDGLDGSNPATQPERWVPGEPLYGSDAWDSEAEHSLACYEADAYGEPQPQWF